MNDRMHVRNSANRGSSLVLCLIVVSAIAAMGLVLTKMALGTNSERQRSGKNLNAVYIAEAGLQLATMELSAGRTGVLGSEGNPAQHGTGEYFVEVQDLGGGMLQLTSTGMENGSTTTVEVLLSTNSSSPYRWAAFGDESLTMDSNALVDSYDSSKGVYIDQRTSGSGSFRYALDSGDVGSNYDITLYSNAKVFGDATPGDGSSATTVGNSAISGSTTPAVEPFVIDSLDFPSIPPSGSLSSSGDSTLSSGDYNFTSFSLDSNSSLTITGPATIVTTTMELNSKSELIIDATNGPVEFWVYTDFIMDSNTLIASTTYDPADVQLYLNADNVLDPDQDVDVDGEVSFDSNAKLYGTISAPNSSIEINSNFELFGSVVARRVHLDSNSRVHFDVNLLNGASGSSGSYSKVGWRVVGN